MTDPVLLETPAEIIEPDARCVLTIRPRAGTTSLTKYESILSYQEAEEVASLLLSIASRRQFAQAALDDRNMLIIERAP